jgi:hypothetical protein
VVEEVVVQAPRSAIVSKLAAIFVVMMSQSLGERLYNYYIPRVAGKYDFLIR